MRTLLIFLVLVGFSCTSHPRDSTSPSSAHVLTVENRNWSDVVLYDANTGRRLRECVSQQRCKIPISDSFLSASQNAGFLRIGIRAIGASSRSLFILERAYVPTDWELVIQNHFPLSTLFPMRSTQSQDDFL